MFWTLKPSPSLQLYSWTPHLIAPLIVLFQMDLPSVPVFMSVSGLFDVEYRIVVACRNGGIYNFKRFESYLYHVSVCLFYSLCHRGMKESKTIVELNSQPVGLERMGKNIVVGCMDRTMQCFTSKVLLLTSELF
jgi:Bardet-Biedl syndrome 1 protein